MFPVLMFYILEQDVMHLIWKPLSKMQDGKINYKNNFQPDSNVKC